MSISGAGGKGGGGSVRTPREDANTLRSRAQVTLIEMLGEGPCEGFADERNVTIKDCDLLIPPVIENGEVKYPVLSFPRESDDCITVKVTGAYREAIVSDSSGYPFDVSAGYTYPVLMQSEGEFAVACRFKVEIFPRDLDEQVHTIRPYTQTAHGFSVGMYVFYNGTVWLPATDDVALYETRQITSVTGPNGFNAALTVHPLGKVRGLRILSNGTGYSAEASFSLPSAVASAVFFDNLPMADPRTLTPNFQDIRLQYRLGYEDQSPMTGFDKVEALVVNENTLVPITSTNPGPAPATYTFENKDWDSLLVNITLVNGFYAQNIENGDIVRLHRGNGLAVHLRFRQRFKLAGASPSTYSIWQPFGDEFYWIEGKTMSPYERTYEARLMRPDVTQRYDWQIEISRLTPDDENEGYQQSHPNMRTFSTVAVSRITSVSETKLSYPNCTLIGLEFNASQFGSNPRRSYRFKQRVVQVPTNYFPPFTVKSYRNALGVPVRSLRQQGEFCRMPDGQGAYTSTGTPIEQPWDGSFYNAWTNNNAWCAYDLSTNLDYGLGSHLGAMNKWQLYVISRYCNEMVMNGEINGSYTNPEMRFTLDAYFQEAQPAFEVLRDFGSSFAGAFYYNGGHPVAVADMPGKVRMTLNPTDVADGMFNLAATDLTTRRPVVVVRYNEPKSADTLETVFHEDAAGLERYGARISDPAVLVGCRRKGQARRHAVRIALQNLYHTEILTVTAGAKAMMLRPYDIYAVYDPARSTRPYGGRIINFSLDAAGHSIIHTDRIIPDSALDEDVNNYSVVCSAPTAYVDVATLNTEEELALFVKSQVTDPLPVRAFSTDEYGRRLIVINGVVPANVHVGGVFNLQTARVQPKLYRVISVESVNEKQLEFVVLGTEYNPAIHDAVDKDGIYSEAPITPDIDAWKKAWPPRNLLLWVNSKLDQERLIYELTASWSKPEYGFALEYEVWIRKGLGNWQFFTRTRETSVFMPLSEPDNYCVQVYTLGINNRRSTPIEACTIVGTLTGENEEIVSGLELTGQGNDHVFRTNDASFDWRVNWSGVVDSSLQAGVPPVLPPQVSDYDLQVLDLNNALLLSTRVTTTNYLLALDQNKTLLGGPHREFIFKVRARTSDGAFSAATAIRVLNEQHALPDHTIEADSLGNVVIKFSDQREPDFKAYRVWIAAGTGFLPSSVNLAYEGDSSVITLPIEIGVPSYVRVAAVDGLTSAVDDCIISDEVSVTGYKETRLSILDFRV